MLFQKSFRVLIVLFIFFNTSFAQSAGYITGNVFLPDGSRVTQSIRISLETMRGVKSSVYTDNQGAFVFRNLTPGLYQVIVDAEPLWETTTFSVEVFPRAPAIANIVLREKKYSTTKAKGGSVSTGELASTIPPKAKKEFDRASELSRQAKIDEAISSLRKAIELYPDYLMAINDLGALLIEQEKFSEAETELRKAMKLDPKAFNPQLNLGIVLLKQTRFEEARDVLNRALSLEPNSPAARYSLGEAQEGLLEVDLALKEFTAAYDLGGQTFAIALYRLGELYMKSGKRELAKKAFEKYIAEAPTGNAVAQAKMRLQQLR